MCSSHVWTLRFVNKVIKIKNKIYATVLIEIMNQYLSTSCVHVGSQVILLHLKIIALFMKNR